MRRTEVLRELSARVNSSVAFVRFDDCAVDHLRVCESSLSVSVFGGQVKR